MNRFLSLTIAITLFIAALFIFDSCNKESEDDSSNGNDDYSIPATTKVVGMDTWDNHFVSLDSSDFTLRFQKGLTDELSISIGDIIVAEAGGGLLRRVTNIQDEGNNIVISTSFASLAEAVERGSFSFDEDINGLKVSSVNYLSEGVTFKEIPTRDGQGTTQRYEFNKNLDDDGLVNLSGYIDLQPALTGDLTINNLSVQNLFVEFRCQEYSDITTTIKLLSFEFNKEILIADVNMAPIIAKIGSVPVVIVPELELSIGAIFNVETVIDAGIEQSLNFIAGMEYKNNKWNTYHQVNKWYDYTQPALISASAGVKTYVKPQMNFKFYTVVAPYVFGEIYSKIDAVLFKYPYPFWKMQGGAGIGIGVEVEIFDKELIDFSTDPPLIEYKVTVAQSEVDSIIDDRDGKSYYIVPIGNQTWFAQNLNHSTTGSWWYDDYATHGVTYGKLYTWNAAATACPSGWHLPSDDEWKTLEMFLGMSQNEADKDGIRGTNEGRKLKSTFGWYPAPSNGRNEVGFWALPGGFRSGTGDFQLLSVQGYWWTATNSDPGKVWYRALGSTPESATKIARRDIVVGTAEPFSFSVRCIKD